MKIGKIIKFYNTLETYSLHVFLLNKALVWSLSIISLGVEQLAIFIATNDPYLTYCLLAGNCTLDPAVALKCQRLLDKCLRSGNGRDSQAHSFKIS